MRCTYVLFAVLGKEHDQFVDGSGSFTQNRQKVECDRIDLEETDIARVENVTPCSCCEELDRQIAVSLARSFTHTEPFVLSQ